MRGTQLLATLRQMEKWELAEKPTHIDRKCSERWRVGRVSRRSIFLTRKKPRPPKQLSGPTRMRGRRRQREGRK
eukprot:2847743-Pleurochrysis_carterae.AAC.2